MSATELVKADPNELARQDEPQSIMAVIARAAADPRCDVAKMQALLDMQERISRHEAEVEFNAALARLMPKLPRIEKDGVIRDKHGAIRSKYARYEDIDFVTRPLLAEEGFSISFNTDDSVRGYVKVIGTLSHRMGYSRPSNSPLFPIDNPVISGAQAVGSAISFAKRYVVINMLNIITVGTDLDGTSDPKPISEEQAMTIETLLTDTKADKTKFYAWAGVAKVEEILEKDLPKVMAMLQAKARK